MEERLIDLETKVSYQEDLIDKLNEVVMEQEEAIALLNKKFVKLTKYINSKTDTDLKDIADEVPPPHY